jgi:hypothetical protein
MSVLTERTPPEEPGRTRPLRVVRGRIRHDGHEFDSLAETIVYDGFRVVAAELPEFHRLAVIPQAAVVTVGRRRHFIVDLVVVHRGRAAGVEVDGPHHRGRLAADVSRDAILVAHGLAFVDRIVVEETRDPAAVQHFCRRVLARLTP